MKALHHGSGCYIPKDVATCPECDAELYARSFAWDEKTGAPIGSEIQVDCVRDTDATNGLWHHWHQSQWQPVLDAIRKWCGAINE